MFGRSCYRFSLGPRLALVLFGFGALLLSPMKLQSQEPESVSLLLQRSRSTVSESLTTGVALSNVIENWSENSEKLNRDMQSLYQELETFSERLNRALSLAEKQGDSLENWSVSYKSLSKSTTDYVNLTESQFKKVEKERQAAIVSRNRWRTVSIGLAAVAVVEGVILFIK